MIKLNRILFAILAGSILLAAPSAHSEPRYSWKYAAKQGETLEARVKPPRGFKRVSAATGSFAEWLRGLPMKPNSSPVMLHNGKKKWNQLAHLHVIDIDTGKRDLQQCADAVMRLRAEYLYSQQRFSEIAFNYTNGKRVRYTRWTRSRDYRRFRKYMTLIFAYAGTYSLSKEMKSVPVSKMKIGDVFIQGGFPGHAVLIADMVVNPAGEKRFLLIQSFMPAQDMHILRNPLNPGSPWYDVKVAATLLTPEWKFKRTDLKRFR